MSYRTIFAAVSGGTATGGVLELACRLARRFEAHLEGFHVKVDPGEMLIMVANGLSGPLARRWIDEVRDEAGVTAAKTKAEFEAATARHGIPAAASPPKVVASAGWREEEGFPSVLVARRARFFDLAVLGRSGRVLDQPHTDTIDETLLRSGRPVLLAPAQPPETFGDAVALGWNGSPGSVRAMAGALPFIASARSVSILTIGEEEGRELSSVVDYLAWQGVAATHRYLRPVSGVAAGQQLLAAAQDSGADLVVMGAYGQAPWRESLFGGVTVEVVSSSRLPVLLSN